jgi:diguanylate cyclase (GGDEF)-like protein
MTSLGTEKDAARSAALRSLQPTDTTSEPEFEDLVALAAAICEAPICLLSAMDETRLWFLARRGMDATEYPRNDSFCQYTILQDDMLLIEDAKLDAFFCNHPAVVGEPGVRFYAGLAIYSPDRKPIGTLCIADHVPRQLSELQISTLRVLAKQASALFELRQRRIELESANARLAALAATDVLTGLPNRRAFDERLLAEFTQARRKKRPLSVMLIDVDHFKRLNDEFGHDAGDRCLQEMAVLLQTVLRKSDLIARYGGEEFALLFPETSASDAEQLGERLLEAVRTHPWKLMKKTVSGGVAELTAETADQQELVRKADAALYAAKDQGRDRILLADA